MGLVDSKLETFSVFTRRKPVAQELVRAPDVFKIITERPNVI